MYCDIENAITMVPENLFTSNATIHNDINVHAKSKEFSVGMFGTASIHDNLSYVIVGLNTERIYLIK